MIQRRHLAIPLVALILLSACGSGTAPTTDDSDGPVQDSDGNSSGFLAADVIHEITIAADDDEYADAIAAYEADESKEWIHATVTIDGAVYEDAGIRLKGNSSLFSLRNNGPGGPGGDADAEQPESLPWLIRLDKYVAGQSHEGISEIVVRSNNTETALNEAVALDLLELSGLAFQDSAYTSFSFNGSDAVLRLVMEHPDDVWMTAQFSAAGILYKAEATGDYSYRGDDPETYDEVFDVEAGDDDLTPLISFLDFLNNSDDATFYAELEQWLDTDAFATYLALQELIANSDDIDGRGNNSYLYYDSEEEAFTVVAWDHNLAFGGFAGGRDAPQGEFTRPDRGTSAGATQPGGELTEIAAERPVVGPGNRPGGPPGDAAATNILVDRFLADSDYASLYESELERLTTELYESGVAGEVLNTWETLLEGSGLIAAATVSDEADTIRSFFD